MEQTKIDKLRDKLVELRKEREKIILEKGMAAEENKDLRENSTYDYWFEKEMVITANILNLTRDIQELSVKHKPKKKLKHRNTSKIKGNYQSHKWL